MSTTCQQVYVRARASSLANADITPTKYEILSRIDNDQTRLFAELASVARDRFQTTALLTSTSGSSARSFDVSALSPSLERILSLTLGDGREVFQVDVLDQEAELAPRYLVRGQSLLEVSNDWRTGTGTVTATLVYVYGPTSIDPAGAFSQTITVPDAWADLLVFPLERYLAEKRGAPDGELAQIDARIAAHRDAFLQYLTNLGGVESKRFDLPTPNRGGNAKQ